MSDRGDSFQIRTVQYGAVGLALSVLFTLAQTLTSASERLHAERAVEEFREGNFAENAGDCAAAIEHYRTGLELAEDATYRLALARCLIKEGRMSEGDTYLSQVLAGDPTSGEANLLRAGLLADAGSVDQATLFYERSITGSWPMGDTKGRYLARSDLVELLYGVQRWRELLPQLLQLRENPSVDDSQRVRIASMFLEARAPTEARDMLTAMVQAGVRRADVQALLGRAYLELRQPQAASAALRAATELEPERADIASEAAFAAAIASGNPDVAGLGATERRRREVVLGRVALARMRRCAAFEESFGDEAESTLERALRRPEQVEAPRLRELIVTLWSRSGPTCGAENNEERALEYLLPDLRPQTEAESK